MKPGFLLSCCFCFQLGFAQSLDYISVRKTNGRVVKNFYAGANILLQTTDGSYLQGPIRAIRNDSVFITLYDVRRYTTTLGSILRDTISTSVASLSRTEIARVHLGRKIGFFQRNAGPLLMAGGGGYLLLNVLNGALFDLPVADGKNLRRLSFSARAFGLGFLLNKIFKTDGFSKKTHRIVYVDL